MKDTIEGEIRYNEFMLFLRQMGGQTLALTVGVIREINRYPVKSFAGEQLEACDIDSSGVAGDRVCSFHDERKQGWKRFVTARNLPNMLTYQARYRNGEVAVTAADGRAFRWDGQLLAEIQSQTPIPVSLSDLKQPHPENSSLLSVDEASILIVADGSLKKLGELWGQEVDQRRFRGNFVIALNDESLFEGDWIGQRLRIGEAELQVNKLCERCIMTTMDPDTAEKTPSLLKIVYKELGLHFGVYASVIRTGRISAGDEVYLLDETSSQ